MASADTLTLMDSEADTEPTTEYSRDVELMLVVKEGGGDAERAFAELIAIHQHAVIGTVGKMLGGSSDAEDIAQQVFIRLWKSAKRYKPTAKFTTFLFTITRNLVFNETKRRKTKKAYSIEEQSDDWGQQYPDHKIRTPAEALRDTELQDVVDRAIAALPKKQRLALTLRRYQQLPYDEIAQIMGMSLAALKSTLFRAREHLKKELSSYLE